MWIWAPKLTTLMYAFNLKADDFEFIMTIVNLSRSFTWVSSIVSSEHLYKDDIDVCVVFAWNFYESIINKHSKWNINGKMFINPIENID